MAEKTRKMLCPRCGVGQCEQQVTPYVDVIDGCFLSVPNVAVFVCDVCHYAEFDQNSLKSLLDTMNVDEYSKSLQSPLSSTHLSNFDD